MTTDDYPVTGDTQVIEHLNYGIMGEGVLHDYRGELQAHPGQFYPMHSSWRGISIAVRNDAPGYWIVTAKGVERVGFRSIDAALAAARML